MTDVHYKTNLSFNEQIELMKYAKSICKFWTYEELDCNISYMRRSVEKDFDDALAIFKKHKTHFCVIFRNIMPNNKYLEISMSDFKIPSSFLWIHLDQSHIPEICKNFET